MTHLEFVTLLHPDELQIIGTMCPSLKEVTFGQEETKYKEGDDYSEGDTFPPEMLISPENLETVLQKWPKVCQLLHRFTSSLIFNF